MNTDLHGTNTVFFATEHSEATEKNSHELTRKRISENS